MLVMKFGGASVAKPESFSKIANLIKTKLAEDSRIAVVISAMGNTTDQLLQLAFQVHPEPPRRELDMMISTGERISISLLAMALNQIGIEAVSFTGSQSGIITDEDHSNAKIITVRPARLFPVLEKGCVAIVAGFQGVSRKGEITTLGRGGSDTTAVALAAALQAPCVEFYKDVRGVFSEDPKLFPEAQFFSELSYKQAFELMQKGAKILHPRCISLAEKNGIVLSIQSFEHPFEQGTRIGSGEKLCETLVFEQEVCCV